MEIKEKKTKTLRVPLLDFPTRIDHFLAGKIDFLSRNQLQKAIRQGRVLVNNDPVKVSHCLVAGDRLDFLWPLVTSKASSTLKPAAIPLDIVYEDDQLLVVNKAAEMVVHPGCGHWENTLVQALLHHFGPLPNMPGNSDRPGLVHRIDKGTSGLLLVGKTLEALGDLQRQFMAHTIERTYTALVWGNLEAQQGTIDAPLVRDQKDRRRMTLHLRGRKGKRAVTHYEVVERLGWVNRVVCRLETGRTHQIRAHLADKGHPLFGDMRYGGNRIRQGKKTAKFTAFVENNFALWPHQALHAASIGCCHPQTKRMMRWAAPLPPNFEAMLRRWRLYYAKHWQK